MYLEQEWLYFFLRALGGGQVLADTGARGLDLLTCSEELTFEGKGKQITSNLAWEVCCSVLSCLV